ncbi:DUF3088 domain-containing protein [Pigmentiphaga aceris]|uniref:DUF3088 domain-containing protein n=1 Tax=Pigmentiphaga aceris TaxID=1940612 RepID=A0A5C0B2A7_9BURK|nr:DUF3088 domain-containing protein [Pigmentiphaga aceris]QEI06901.1 DUF3088 domain-containing protein [Pigmentiphaga aceris]
MSRDRLFLLSPGFADANHPGERFVCPDCIPIEGLLAAAPDLLGKLDISHHPFARPRTGVIAALDADHQGLPVLIFGDEQPAPADAESVGSVRFVTDTRRILDLLAERHGFPKLH